MKKIKVLVVDDSAFMRKAISRIIESDDAFEVVATSQDGLDALEKIKEYNPDVVTLDVEMPKMNGLDALIEIRKIDSFLPVIIVSSVTKFGSDIAIRCLEEGAFDIVRKPESYVSMDIHKISKNLIDKLKAATHVRTKSKPEKLRKVFGKKEPRKKESIVKPIRKREKRKPSREQKVITIGCSTGGPAALTKILTELPMDFPAGIVIVQHMPPGSFIDSLAERLDSYSYLDVKVANEGDIIHDGVAYIARIGKHVYFRQYKGTYKIRLRNFPQEVLHIPSIDVFFQSAGELIGINNISCILTGMGSDGAKGLKYVYQNGGYAIAESEETCVVYGMPRSAVEAGLVNRVVPLHRIPSLLNRLAKK